MRHVNFWIGLMAPALALAASPALAQQTAPTPDPRGMNESNQTRELENEIEEYPGPNDGVREEGAEMRIPEKIRPTPEPRQSARPHAASPASPMRPDRGGSSSIDPGEVQRVMGRDIGVVALASLDSARVTRMQLRLRELGHDPGPIDGVVGPQTRAALEAYGRAQFTLKQRLLRQDQLTSDMAQQLGVDASRAAPSGEPFLRDDLGPSMRQDTPLLPPGGAPLPPPGIAPLPTPSSAPSSPPRAGGGSTPATPPPAP